MQGDNEDEIDELINAFDMEFIAYCFDTRNKFPCCWWNDHKKTKELETKKNGKAVRKYSSHMNKLSILMFWLNYLFNLYSQQSRKSFLTNAKEMKAFKAVNYVMAVNELSSIQMYWDCGHFIGNVGMHNIFTRARYQEFFQNLNFTDNTKQDETDKSYRIGPIINCLNASFQAEF